MTNAEKRLQEELNQLYQLRDQAQSAMDNIHSLLQKADERSAQDESRRWNRIIDNLEGGLLLARAKLTVYDQRIREKERDLAQARQSELDLSAAQDVFPLDTPMPKERIAAAERILAISLDELRGLTLEQVAEMNTKLFEENADLVSDLRRQDQEPGRKSILASRIERARQARQAIQAGHKSDEPSFAERRKQKTFREAMTKLLTGNGKTMDLPEIECVLQHYSGLCAKPQLLECDVRLKNLLGSRLEELQNRGSELRRKRAQTYLKNRP